MHKSNMGSSDVTGFDFRLQHPFSCVISGPSNSGKTFFVKMLIANADNVICNKTKNIVYIYDCWQPLYDELLKIRDIKFIQGIPRALDDDELLPVTKNNLLIIDDVRKDASGNTEVEKVFTQYVHHRNLTLTYFSKTRETTTRLPFWQDRCILVTQNFFWNVLKMLQKNPMDTS